MKMREIRGSFEHQRIGFAGFEVLLQRQLRLLLAIVAPRVDLEDFVL
jgi:hypothetical protein